MKTTDGRFPEHGQAQVEVWTVDSGRDGFEEDVDDDFGIAELGIELVAESLINSESGEKFTMLQTV